MIRRSFEAAKAGANAEGVAETPRRQEPSEATFPTMLAAPTDDGPETTTWPVAGGTAALPSAPRPPAAAKEMRAPLPPKRTPLPGLPLPGLPLGLPLPDLLLPGLPLP